MKDAFGNELVVGSKVVYNADGGMFCVGEVTKLHPHKPDKGKRYTPPDKVSVQVAKHSGPKAIVFTRPSILYASNVMLLTSTQSA